MAWMSRRGTLVSSWGSMAGLTTKAWCPASSSRSTRSQARSASAGASRRVAMGWRPGGSSSSTDCSRSPNRARARERGMGVALMTSQWGSRPFCLSASRWRTPNRCCSSTTTSCSLRNVTASWNRAWVPTT